MNHLEERLQELTHEIAYMEQNNLRFSPSYHDKREALKNLLYRINKDTKIGEDL